MPLTTLALIASLALGQATTEPAPAAPAYQPPRQRDAAGYILRETPRGNWWESAVFYQVFVRSFQDSASGPLANDGIGDIPGLISRLDYLNDGNPATTTDLGVTALWLMPMHPSPSYHGYDIDDYYAINPQYGTLDDFRRLMAECHKRGIRVILDLVINHTSARHQWFLDAQNPKSPRHDWYIWAESNPNYRGPWGQQVWHTLRRSQPANGQPRPAADPVDAANPVAPGTAGNPFFYGLFSREMPDLNFRNPELSQEILNVTRFWLDASKNGVGAGVAPAADGFRLDAIRHLIENGRAQDNTLETHQWLMTFYETYKRTNPQAVAVGEVWASTEIASSYVGNQMDMAFEFDLAGAMIASINAGDAAFIELAQKKVLKFYPPNQYGRFLSNHDQTRVASDLAKGSPDGIAPQGKLRVAASLLLTGPGVPFIYYGEELGQPGTKPDPDLRTPMRWHEFTNPDNANWGGGVRPFSTVKPWRMPFKSPPGTSVQAQINDKDSLLTWYRTLIALRAKHAPLSSGEMVPLACDQPEVYAFLRTLGPDAVLVVINLSDKPVERAMLSLPADIARSTSPIAAGTVLSDVLTDRSPLTLTIDTKNDKTLRPIKIPELRPYQTMLMPIKK